MPFGSTYTLRLNGQSVSAAISLLQIKAGTTGGLQILRAWCAARGVTTPVQQPIQIVRKSAAATVTAAVLGTSLFDQFATGVTPSSVLSTTGTGVNASAEGTDGDVPYQDDFDVLAGWTYIPVPEERIFVPASGIIALKFNAAPAAATTFDAGIVFEELG